MKTASATAAAITGTVAALSDRELLAQTGNLARVERHLQGAIIDHLAEIEARSLFLRRGFASLFEYAVRELGYSDAAAGRRIAAMRLCADNPQTRERLRDGSLSLSAAAELQWAFDRQRRRVPPVAATATRRADTPRADTPQAATTPAVAALPTEPPLVLDAVGRQKLVEEAAGKSTRQVKRMLADLDPELAAGGRSRAPARQRPLRAEGAHRRGVSARPGAACGLAVARGPAHDGGTARRPASAGGAGPPRPEPAAPAHRQSAGRRACARRANSGGGAGGGPPDRFAAEADCPAGSQRHFDGTDPAGLRRPRRSGAEVTGFGPCHSGGGEARGLATRRGRCRYVDPHTGRRCTSRHLLQIDHVLPYTLGGGSDPANLRLLCHAHHRHRHRSASAVSPTRNPEDPSFLTHPCLVMDATTLPSRSPGARPSPPGAASRTAARFSTAATIALRCRQ